MNVYKKLEKKILASLKANLKEIRFVHSLSVAKTAATLCKIYSEDEQKGYFAGLVHDMCKYFTKEELLNTAKLDSSPILDYELRIPELLHGRACAVVLSQKYGVTDKSILDAVKYHTLGHPSLDNLGKIIFVADKIEPNRPQMTKELFTEYTKMSLNQLTLLVVKDSLDYNIKKGNRIPFVSIEFYNSLNMELFRRNDE